MRTFILFMVMVNVLVMPLRAQDKDDINSSDIASGTIFDDKALLEGYAQKYADQSKEILNKMLTMPTLQRKSKNI